MEDGPQAPRDAQEEGAQMIEARSKEVCPHSWVQALQC